MTAFRKEILFSAVVGLTRNLQRSRELEHKNMIQRRDSDTEVTSHMYEGQKWLALSRRLIAKHMSSKFKRRGYLERAAFVCDAFCD